MYNKHNFYRNTYCEFNEAHVNEINSLVCSYKSKSGSRYYFTEQGVYRYSNHWGRAARCKWKLNTHTKNTNRTKLGFAKWVDFFPENDYEKLYFITVDFEAKTAQYYHKNSIHFKSEEVLRNSTETMTILKKIRQLLTENQWCKYLKTVDIDTLRKQIVEEMLTSGKSFQEIRQKYLL